MGRGREANMYGSGSADMIEVGGEEEVLMGKLDCQGILACPRGLREQERWMRKGRLTCMIQEPHV